MEVFGPRVEAANTLLLVAETDTDRLGDVQHIRNIIPAVRVVHSRQVIIDHARSIFFEQAD